MSNPSCHAFHHSLVCSLLTCKPYRTSIVKEKKPHAYDFSYSVDAVVICRRDNKNGA